MEATQALYEGLTQYLKGLGGNWADRVYPDVIPPTIARPYATFFIAAGGELNAVKQADAGLTLTVKCVADTGSAAFIGSAQIAQGLNDRGQQDATSAPLSAPTGSGWLILTITQGRKVHLVERFADARPVYHSGHQFRFHMTKDA